MKTKLLIIAGLLVIAFVVMITPVMADTTGTTAVTGNPSLYVAIQLNQSSINLPLDPNSGSAATNGTLGITVSANGPFSVTVADNGAVKGRTATSGYMSNFTGSSYDLVATHLNSALGLTGTTTGTTNAEVISTPISADGDTLYSGTAPVTDQLLTPNTISQNVANNDLVLPPGSTYRIDLLFTIGAP